MSDYEFINKGRGAKTLVPYSNKKKKSLRQQTSTGTGKNNKQSDGFFTMLVKEGKKLYKEFID